MIIYPHIIMIMICMAMKRHLLIIIMIILLQTFLMALDKVCFDNQVSTFSDKILWFEVNVEDPDDDYTDDDDYFGDCA